MIRPAPKFHLVLWLVIFLAGCTLTLGRSIPSYAGPYIAYVSRLYDSYENETDDPIRSASVHIHVGHFNRYKPYEKQLGWGNASLLLDVDDTFGMKVVIDKWSHNQWKSNFMVMNFPGGACSTLRNNIPGLFHRVFKPKRMTGPCFVSKGLYIIEQGPMDWTLPNFPQLPYGKYLAKMTITRRDRRDRVVLRIVGEVTTIPQP